MWNKDTAAGSGTKREKEGVPGVLGMSRDTSVSDFLRWEEGCSVLRLRETS